MADAYNDFSEVNSLYGPGNAGSWLCCCLSAIILTHFDDQHQRDPRVTYDLVIATIYAIWASIEATVDVLTFDKSLGPVWPRPYVNRIYTPMTICATWIWLITPSLLYQFPRPKASFEVLEKRLHRVRNTALLWATLVVAFFGLQLPLLILSLPYSDHRGICSLFDGEPAYLFPLLVCAPSYLVLLNASRRGKFGEIYYTLSKGAFSAVVTGVLICGFFASSAFGLWAFFASLMQTVKTSGSTPQECHFKEMELPELRRTFTVLPKTNVAMTGDQAFALVCGILTVLRSLKVVLGYDRLLSGYVQYLFGS